MNCIQLVNSGMLTNHHQEQVAVDTLRSSYNSRMAKTTTVVASYSELYEEGEVEHINGVWPVFLLKLAKFKAHWSNFITCSRCGQPPLYKSPITSPRWPFE